MVRQVGNGWGNADAAACQHQPPEMELGHIVMTQMTHLPGDPMIQFYVWSALETGMQCSDRYGGARGRSDAGELSLPA